MSGTTLHTVSRLLSAWEKKGIVESRRKHVSICNATELKALGVAS
jgi:DNA-binding transcriptional regulator YhcF (GntR family)